MKKPKERLKFKGPKIGSKLRIRLPNDYGVWGGNNENLKKWSVEQAQSRTYIDDNGNTVQLDLITTAQKIYDWVRK